jgi:hypothetical protein
MRTIEDELITGIIVEPEGERVRVKFLAMVGGCGPELKLGGTLPEILRDLLTAYLETGKRQEHLS